MKNINNLKNGILEFEPEKFTSEKNLEAYDLASSTAPEVAAFKERHRWQPESAAKPQLLDPRLVAMTAASTAARQLKPQMSMAIDSVKRRTDAATDLGIVSRLYTRKT